MKSLSSFRATVSLVISLQIFVLLLFQILLCSLSISNTVFFFFFFTFLFLLLLMRFGFFSVLHLCQDLFLGLVTVAASVKKLNLNLFSDARDLLKVFHILCSSRYFAEERCISHSRHLHQLMENLEVALKTLWIVMFELE